MEEKSEDFDYEIEAEPDTNMRNINPEKGKFRLQNKWIFLTYPECKLSKKEIAGEIRHAVKNKVSIIQSYYALEKHESGRPHIHAALWFDKPLNTRDCRFFDIQKKYDDDFFGDDDEPDFWHPNIKVMKSEMDWNNVVEYISKSDKSLKNVHKRSKELKQVWSCKSKAEAFALLNEMKPIDISTIYDAKPNGRKWGEGIEPCPDLPWVEKFFAFEQEKRTIHWIYDEYGKSGKTDLGRHLLDCDKGIYLPIAGKINDIANTMNLLISQGFNTDRIMVNCTRTCGDLIKTRREISEAIEFIKDGVMMSHKYQGTLCKLTGREVLCVVSNWLPVTKQLSPDRWRIWCMTEERDIVPLSISKVEIMAREQKDELIKEKLKEKEYEKLLEATARLEFEKENTELIAEIEARFAESKRKQRESIFQDSEDDISV